MSDDWDFYPLHVDSEPASIYLDLGLATEAPNRAQPHIAYVRVFMRQPRPDGLSSNEEFDELVRVEDSLEAIIASGSNTTYTGRNTSSGNRDFYFYTADPEAFAEAVESKMSAHPEYQFEIGARHDPEWSVYFEFLYPSPDDLQRILNRRVTDNLAAHGDNLSEPRPIDHFAYLPNEAAAANLREFLGKQDFAIDEPRAESGSVVLSFKRSDRPDQINDIVVPIARRVQELGGEYDGWGCEVIN
jgi:uncharacterized protein (TIGR01619 family)